MVIVFEAHAAVTPAGRPAGVPIPVARVVAWVMLVIRVLIQSDGEEDAAPTVMSALTVIVPVAFTVPQPPDNGIE